MLNWGPRLVRGKLNECQTKFELPVPDRFWFLYSLAAALAVSAPLRDIVAAITKIFFSYDYANTIASPVGAAHLDVFVDGTTLHVRFPSLLSIILRASSL